MPLSPSVLLVFGGIGEHLQAEIVLTGDEARQLADGVNTALTGQAYDWIAANVSPNTRRSLDVLPASEPAPRRLATVAAS
jgi:hypothetical protein